MSITVALLIGTMAAMEVSQEPVAVVVKYPDMQQISLKPEDVMIYSEDIPQVETVSGTEVRYSARTLAEMVAANVPEPTPESQPTLPNESRTKKRLDHTPPFNGTVTGDVSIIESGPNERIIVISNIKGDGIMQVLVKGGTARKSTGAEAAPVVESPKVIVRNSKPATKVNVGGAAEPKSASTLNAAQRTKLEGHFKGKIPPNLKMIAEPITVE